jgi:quinol monooxygenase YgiN
MNETATLQVVARVITRPDTVDAVKRILVGMLEPSRAEDGCLVYELLQCQDDPTDFTFVEECTDAAALERPAASPHIAGAQADQRALVAAPTVVRKNTLIEN